MENKTKNEGKGADTHLTSLLSWLTWEKCCGTLCVPSPRKRASKGPGVRVRLWRGDGLPSWNLNSETTIQSLVW